MMSVQPVLAICAAAALIAGVFAPSAQAATEETAMSLCQIEIGVDEVPQLDRRPEAVGFMKRADGKVSVLRRNAKDVEELPAEIGMDLYAQDAVITGPNAGFDAIFTDNTTVSGVADTCVEISKYYFKPDQGAGEFRMRLGRGVVSVAAGRVAKLRGDTMSVKVRNDTNLAVTGTRIVIRAK